MKTKILLIIFLCGVFTGLKAQDFIHFTNGEVLRTKVIEIGNSEIRYKKFDNLQGPDYVANKSDVEMIKYSNGQVENFSPAQKETQVNIVKPEESKIAPVEAPSHSISVNIMNMLFMSDLTLQYEWVNRSSSLGVRIPITIGFFNRTFGVMTSGDFLGYNNVLSGGVDLRVYPGRVKKTRYVFGPSINAGYIYSAEPFSNLDGNTVYGTDYLFKFFLLNGFVSEPTKHFRMGLDVGFGFITNFKRDETSMFDPYNRPAINFNLHMGYKF